MAAITEIDIRLMVGRLRPGSAYHWRGNGTQGNTMAAIGEWRDANTRPPTEAEIVAEWDVYQQEVAAEEAAWQKLEDTRRDYKGEELDVSGYAGETAAIRRLAEKIAWLEQEMAGIQRGERG